MGIDLFPPSWLVGFSQALKWLRARCGWGDPGVAWSRVVAKFYLQPPHFTFTLSTNHFAAIMVLNFPQPPHFTFAFPQLILLPIILHSCLITVCHPGISPPPRPTLYGEATWYEFSPSHIPPHLALSLEQIEQTHLLEDIV